MRILIADDDPVSRRLLEGTLVKLGHDVIAVSDGTAAEAALRAPDGPRLAILDWMMPGLDGLAVCQAIRRQHAPYVYLILLTAKDRHEDLVAGLNAEADEFLTKPLDAVELRVRLRSGERVLNVQERLLRAQEALQAEQERLLRAQEALQAEATHDRLTGLWNRGAILDHLERQRSQMQREGRPLAVVVLDVDHFKRINDTYGHQTGDVVLRDTARRMRSVMRGHETLGRYGGEEFLAVLPGCDLVAAHQVGERLRVTIAAEAFRVGDLTVPVTISAGVSWAEHAKDESDVLIHAADDALYLAKARGRNRVEWSTRSGLPKALTAARGRAVRPTGAETESPAGGPAWVSAPTT